VLILLFCDYVHCPRCLALQPIIHPPCDGLQRKEDTSENLRKSGEMFESCSFPPSPLISGDNSKQISSFLFQHSLLIPPYVAFVRKRALQAGQKPEFNNCTAIEYDGPAFHMKDITDPCFVPPRKCPLQFVAVFMSTFSCGCVSFSCVDIRTTSLPSRATVRIPIL